MPSTKKNITIISEYLPTSKLLGGAVNLIWTIKGFLRKNYRVSIICFKNLNPWEDSTDESLIFLKNIGVSSINLIEGERETEITRPLLSRIKFLFRFFIYDSLLNKNSQLLKEELKKSKSDFYLAQPDVLKYINFNLSDKLITSWIGHPGYPFFEINYNFSKKGLYHFLSYKIRKFLFVRTIAKSLNRMSFCIGSPKFWVNEWQKKLKYTKVYNTPCFTEYIPEIKKEVNSNNEKISIVILGSPNAGLTKMGLYYFNEIIWPSILSRKLEKEVKVSVVGKLIDNNDLIKSLKRKSVEFKGFVNDINNIIYQTDIILIPNNLAPSAGSKLATISSLSACILVHRVLIKSHNEFREGFNCLAAEEGVEFVDKILLLKKNRNLRLKLKANARKTFERFFTTDRFINKLEYLYEKYSNKKLP